jgi:cytochrome c oxidase cbb3-type subunit 1
MPDAETYDDRIIRLFLLGAAFWGVVAMAVGVFCAAQLAWPVLNFDTPWLTFGRLRPVHTLGVIFAFGGSALMGTCYYVVQRTGHTRLAFRRLALFTFWGWQPRCS